MTATKESPIILYDLADANGASWSPNPYKARLALNYKGIPYRVEYVSFPDIEPRMKELGVTPVSNTFPYYTLPVIADPSHDPSGKPTYVSDSFKIAVYLDDKYPAPQYPCIFAPGTRGIQHLLMTQYYSIVAASVGPVFIHKVFNIVDSRSVDYLRRTRGDRVKPLPEELLAQKWEESRERFAALGESLKLNDTTSEAGPFVMGNRVSFVDFALGGTFHFISKLEGEDSARLKEMLEWQDGKWGTLRKRILEIERNSSQVA